MAKIRTNHEHCRIVFNGVRLLNAGDHRLAERRLSKPALWPRAKDMVDRDESLSEPA
jgi:hypothetical protein